MKDMWDNHEFWSIRNLPDFFKKSFPVESLFYIASELNSPTLWTQFPQIYWSDDMPGLSLSLSLSLFPQERN